jgi:glutathione synthase/RimK-type ligase-like ATP-grasp enzyme
MSQLCIVVESLKDWSPYYPSEQVITFDDYLKEHSNKKNRIRVINLCRNMKYLSKGYYCSLLAEARGHVVIPSVKTLNALRNQTSFAIIQDSLHDQSEKLLKKLSSREDHKIHFDLFFGETDIPEFKKLARELFEQLPCPALQIELEWTKAWKIDAIRIIPLPSLNASQQDRFANALDHFSNKLWRKPKLQRMARYDMAILVNDDEKLPPSDTKALNKFIKIGGKLGVDVELIGRKDLRKLSEYDMLFIRETTNIDHHTFRFACRAEAEGLAVIDDPQSIIRCTNKVYLADLFATKGIPTPKTQLISMQDEQTLESIETQIGYPVVLKIPDGSFSRGIIKADDRTSLVAGLTNLLKQSALVIAQEFLYTDFDWRVGVLNGKPLYACKYFMSRNHWQIYNHKEGKVDSGGFQTLPTYEAPKQVINTAVKAASLIGQGLYGVDLKQSGKKVVVIEINDNPSIDAGVEDQFLGDELYRLILEEFIHRVDIRRQLT